MGKRKTQITLLNIQRVKAKGEEEKNNRPALLFLRKTEA
jgi:hypothetical protein